MNLRLVQDNHHHDDDHSRHHEDEEEILEEPQHPLAIFDAEFLGETVPTGFDAVRVRIDGFLKAVSIGQRPQRWPKHMCPKA